MEEARRRYVDFMAQMAMALGPDQYWCVYHPDGPLTEAASKDMGQAVRVVCEALDMDWDDLTGQGFHLGVVDLPETPHDRS